MKNARHGALPADQLAPTPERLRRAPVERAAKAIADDEGRPAQPYRAVDTLMRMERRGTISAAMREAGEDFRAAFRDAHLDALRAFDWSRIGRFSGARVTADEIGVRVEHARRRVHGALHAAGGPASPAGSCLWHVVGAEQSLKEWALTQGWGGRSVSQEAASGILVAALGVLERHFSAERPPRRVRSVPARATSTIPASLP